MILWLGGHWAILQSVAWVQMTLVNAQSLPLGSALAKTFDGRHPCQICKLVQAGKSAGERRPVSAPEPKFEFMPAEEVSVQVSLTGRELAFPDFPSTQLIPEAPSVPPPEFSKAV